MKTVYQYIRVSTDEQAEKGYSQRHQQEMLGHWADINGYQIAATFAEDYSAKTFNRPEWNKLLMMLRKSKGKNSKLIFTKWDRFSRNTSDAYQMISLLNKLGVEPIAIEQPLDLSIPENKMMLSYYLTVPEVENHRRSLNVSDGMRRAKKEGRYMGRAPIGYDNVIINYNKTIQPTSEAHLVKWVFEKVAEGNYSSQSIFTKLLTKRKLSKNAFWNMLRNTAYCGIVIVPATAKEPQQIVRAIHEPIITPELFNRVQEIIDGRKKAPKVRATSLDATYPLRGMIRCPKCAKNLTASSSKGRTKYYTYYHCESACGVRYREAEVNKIIIEELQALQPDPAVKILMQHVMEDVSKQYKEVQQTELRKIRNGLADAQERKEKSLNLLVAGHIAADDFLIIKNKCEQQIFEFEKQMADTQPVQYATVKEDVYKGISVLENIAGLFQNGTPEQRRQLIGSITNEKLDFSNGQHRTIILNEAATLIYNTSKAFSVSINEKKTARQSLVHGVNWLGLEPRAHTLKVYCSTN